MKLWLDFLLEENVPATGGKNERLQYYNLMPWTMSHTAVSAPSQVFAWQQN